MPRQRRTIATAADTKTARWLDHALRKTNLHSKIKSAVSYRLPKSAAVGLDEDHAQNFYVRLLETDGLEKHVTDETDDAPSNMRWWAVKGAYKDIREWGREPTLRIMVGAKTETDLKREKEAAIYTDIYVRAGVAPNVAYQGEVNDWMALDGDQPSVVKSMPVRTANSHADAFEVRVEASTVTVDLDANDLLEDLRQRLEAVYGDGNAAQHLTVVVAVADGASFVEAANAAGCTAAEAKRMMKEIAEVMADK